MVFFVYEMKMFPYDVIEICSVFDEFVNLIIVLVGGGCECLYIV